MDWIVFGGAAFVLLLAVIPMMVFPKQSRSVVVAMNEFVTTNLGATYLVLGLTIFCFVLYIAFGKYGSVTLGRASDRPEFSDFAWASMLFCAGIGSDILYWGVIEWAYYYQGPPQGAKPMSDAALNYATMYGMFHWGPIAWSIYVLPALPIGYLVFVKKQPVFKISQACRPILKGQTDGFIGKLVDILFIFGLIGGTATSLALGVPMISAGLEKLTGINGSSMIVKSFVLLAITVVFAYSSYRGLKKGIQLLSDLNVWLSLILLAFIFIIGPTIFIMETTVTSFGNMIKNFFQMATWLEPFGGIGGREETNFPQQWTIFYWAWWIVYAPFIGLFIARISRGRTLKEVILGTIVYGTFGCVLFFGIFGNYATYLQLTGQFDVIAFLNSHGTEATIIEVVNQLPFAPVMIGLFVLSAFLFLVTTFDSASYIVAAATQIRVKGEPIKMNRLFWAFALCLLPFSLMLVGGEKALEILQTASIVAGVPLIIIFIIIMISFMMILSGDRIALQTRAERFKKIERRSLRILQVSEKDDEDNNL
ncbi:BCCT family transporter [Staphylococcus americanisciuri]|uniref:BCCT family transporter n=1 Tax=Staphylococcus americanisciuri TaxID=2973940 RepID=A0ABT2EZS6_9STAP|nr:BCCT family transporter [Staphylococcus americanisciuri]MCS4485707.1 BCCT family transporter [Staphylococcus americanisciuri]